MRPRSDRLLTLASLTSVALLSAAACFRKIWAVDYWWQYRTGRYVVEHGWPSVDLFSYTVPGEPWIELRWLYCLAQYMVAGHLGTGAVIALKWLAVAAAFTLVAWPALRAGRLAAGGLVLTVALMTTSERFFVRPELVTFVLFALFVLVLERHRQGGTRWIWALPLLQVLWVNSHTLFILGPLLVGLLLCVQLAESRWRLTEVGPAAAVTVATTLACLVSPYGLEGLLFPFRLFGEIRGDSVFNQVIEEFRSPFLVGFARTAVRFYLVLIALVVGSAALNWRRLDPFRALLCLSQLYLSTLAIRNLPLFALAAVPFVLSNLDRSEWLGGAPERWRRPAARAASIATMLVCGWYALAFVTDRFSLREGITTQAGIGIAEHRFPVTALAYLEGEGLEGRLFCEIGSASYLLAHDRRVFIDPRLEVYGDRWLRRYLEVLQDVTSFRAAVGEFDIGILLVPIQSNLTRIALAERDWALVHFDEVAAVFLRRDVLGSREPISTPQAFRASIERLRSALPRPRPSADLTPFERVTLPGPYLAVTDFLLMNGRPVDAAEFLEDAATAAPGLEGLALRRATIAELGEDWEGVIGEAEAGLSATPDDARLQIKLALALERLGRLEEARAWLERSLDSRPGRAKTWARLGSIHARLDALDEAEACLARAVALSPRQADYVGNLARVHARLGRTEEAIAGLEQALRLEPRDVTVLRDLAVLEAGAGDVEAARRYVAMGLELAPGEPTLRRLRDRLARP